MSNRTGSAPKHERPINSDDDVRALPRPRSGRRDNHVKDTPGLIVRVSQTTVSFVVRKRGPRVDGAPGTIHKVVIGHFPAMGVEAAKVEAARVIRLIRAGSDPRMVNASDWSLGRAWQWARENRALRPSTLRDYGNRWTRHLKAHEGARMSSIGPEWIRARVTEAQTGARREGVVEATRLRSLLGMIFTEWCRLNPGVAHPVRVVSKPRRADGSATKPRSGKLTIEQAREYASALAVYAKQGPEEYVDTEYQRRRRQTMADFLTLNMYVGLRKSNGITLRWDCVDIGTGRITIPASETKTGKELVVHAPAPVLAMLKRRRRDPKRHPVFVFPGKCDKPMSAPNKAHRAVLKLAGLPEDACTIHDMRRTLGSAMIAQGADVSEVREQLGHANISTTSIYLNLKGEDTVRQSLDRAARAFSGEGAA
ncbi:MAG: tyrosine-type recombinase/integrase [Phycisphaerales bacterium]